jgi:ribosome biogenesis GTPase A
MILYDTPGLMWPKVEIEECGYRLALAGSIGSNAYDQVDVAWFALETLSERYPQALLQRYGQFDLDQPVEVLFAAIARRRGAMLSGGRVDEQKTAELILTDFRSGTLGRITLETPDDIREPAPEENQAQEEADE